MLKTRQCVVLLALAGALGACDPGGTDARSARCDGYEFDSERWRRVRDGATTLPERDAARARRQLAVGLVRCRVLDGLRRREVYRLLGRPDDSEPRAALYRIGEEPGAFAIDQEWLVIEFDERGVVEFYDVEQL